MRDLERVLKAISDKNRLRILMLLKMRKMCVCEFSAILGITQPSVSKHLKKLISSGLIGSQQDHFWTNYYLKKEHVYAVRLLSCLGKWLGKEGLIKRDLKKQKTIDRRTCT